MRIKIFTKVSPGMCSSYSGTKALFQRLEVPLSVYSSTSSVRHGLILLNRTFSTKTGVQTDIRQTAVVRDEHSGRKNSTSGVNKKSGVSKEKFSKDVLEYLNSKDYLKPILCFLPQKLLKRKTDRPDALYTIDRDVASKCSKCC
jgi:hypothetical protein